MAIKTQLTFRKRAKKISLFTYSARKKTQRISYELNALTATKNFVLATCFFPPIRLKDFHLFSTILDLINWAKSPQKNKKSDRLLIVIAKFKQVHKLRLGKSRSMACSCPTIPSRWPSNIHPKSPCQLCCDLQKTTAESLLHIKKKISFRTDFDFRHTFERLLVLNNCSSCESQRSYQ